jgi:hypothetical protein
MHHFFASATLCALLGLTGIMASAGGAAAAPPEPRIRGPYCTPAGCDPTAGSPLGTGAGFATAAGTALLLARRQRDPDDG